MPIEEESLVAVEVSEPRYSDELPIPSDLAEGEAVVAFDAEANETLLEEPVEQS